MTGGDAVLSRVPLGTGPSLADALRAVRDDERPFALAGRWAGSRALVGSEPLVVVEGSDALEAVDQAPVGGAAGAVGGGWFGSFGFGLGAAIEALPPPPPRPCPTPLASLGYYDHVLRQDADGCWWFEALATAAREEALDRRLAVLRERLAAGAGPRPFELGALVPARGAAARHLAAVRACVERIAAGELFQANLCLRLEARFRGSAADAFLAAAARLQPAYGAFLGRPGGSILSFSPELFLRRSGDALLTSPIKGTAPRAADPRTAARQRAALLASAKDAAEHVMIVDLARNDLGRVARYGTVSAAARRVEPHPGLWHLVTDVSGRLREETGDSAVLRAAFPPGSVTGAPKVQALKVIGELEGTQRELYTGAIGYASPAAGLELNVAIRTLETSGQRAWMGCGGGIVADSEPQAELREALAKARPIAAALGTRVDTPEPVQAPAPRRLPSWPRRPDPSRGLLETIAVRAGRPVSVDRHLARLRTSAEAVYGLPLPAGLREELHVRAASGPGARLRVLATPAEHGLETVVELGPAAAAPAAVALEPHALAGGLGAHKWLDRPPQPVAAPTPLLVDLDGSVLEASWANVWVLRDGVLATPPADGRLLAGVTRERLLLAGSIGAIASVEAPVGLAELHDAEAILLTSAVRIAVPAAVGAAWPSSAAFGLAGLIRGTLAAGEHP